MMEMQNAQFVILNVLNVLIQALIAQYVPQEESIHQNVFVKMAFMKIVTKYANHVAINARHVKDKLINALYAVITESAQIVYAHQEHMMMDKMKTVFHAQVTV